MEGLSGVRSYGLVMEREGRDCQVYGAIDWYWRRKGGRDCQV